MEPRDAKGRPSWRVRAELHRLHQPAGEQGLLFGTGALGRHPATSCQFLRGGEMVLLSPATAMSPLYIGPPGATGFPLLSHSPAGQLHARQQRGREPPNLPACHHITERTAI